MPETALSPLSIRTARPTVRVDGQEVPMLTDLMRGLEMNESEGGLSTLELRVDNIASDASGGADLGFEDGRVLHLGAEIVVYAGDENAPREVFRGTVSALEGDFPETGAPGLVVLAEDVFQKARLARRTKVHDNVSLADLVRSLAGSVGLTPVITGLTAPIGTQVQLNESDLAFLRRLLARYGGDLQVVGKQLQAAAWSGVKRGGVEVEFGSQLRQVKVTADLAHQATAVTTAGWDAVQGLPVAGAASGLRPGPGSGRTGSDALRDVFGERSEHLGYPAVTTQAEAQAVAETSFSRRARQFVRAEGTAEGNPSIRVGTHLTLKGLGPRFSNTYFVTRACHRFDLEAGYRTDFEAECAFMGVGP